MRKRLVAAVVILLVVAGGAAFLLRYRSVSDPHPRGSERAALARLAGTGRPLLFLGLDGADWQLLDRLIAEGKMPSLGTLVREGRAGILTTLDPPLSPLIWTSMLTGTSPLVHGILDFTRFDPETGRREPITSDERLVPAVWNMASEAGKTVGVFGMWATFPAEAVNGVLVSDRLFSFHHPEAHAPEGAVFPGSREGWARDALRSAEREVDLAEMRRFLPWLGEGELAAALARPDSFSEPVSALRRILVETRVYHLLARGFLEESRPNLVIVYFQGTDTIGHVFAPYAPPRRPDVSPGEFERFGSVVDLYYREVDALLGAYRELARKAGMVLMLASDHGFLWGEGRPGKSSSTTAATAGKWHREEGMYLLWGDGIPPRDGRERGSVLQVASTVLAVLSLPRGIGLAAPPLPGSPPLGPGTFDYRTAFARAVPPKPEAQEEGAEEALARLRSLGYIGSAEATAAPREIGHRRQTRTAGSHNNEGLLLRGEGRLAEARAAFERAIELDPRLSSARWNLSDLLDAEKIEAELSDRLLVEALALGLPDGSREAIARAVACRRAGDLERSIRLLEAAVGSRPDDPEIWLYLGRFRLENEACAGALAAFERASSLGRRDATVFASLGLAHSCLGDRTGAEGAFRKSLALDPNQPEVRRLLSTSR